MEAKNMPAPTAEDKCSSDMTWALDDRGLAMWCNSELERSALRDLVSAVLFAESVDACLPLSESLDDLCPVSAGNLQVLKRALKKPGAL
ncbi:MAG: hypothetical protein V1792_21010, partial [Pseudomonadota bacterium]